MKHLSATLLHTAFTEEEKANLDQTIDFIENYKGNNFCLDLTRYLYGLLQIDYIMVASPQNHDKNVFRTLVLLYKGQPIINRVYELKGTPSAVVINQDKDLCYFPYGIQNMFPHDLLLRNFGIESYLGVPLFDSQDNSIGLLALMHSSIIERGGFVEAIINAILPKLENELFLSSKADDNIIFSN